MQYGVFDHLDHGAGGLGELYATRLALIERYEAAGFRGYHLAEHHGTRLGAAPSPGVFLSAAIQRTTRLRLGPLVYCVPLYHPLRLLEEICMLDQMSGGRLELGVGRGVSPIEVAFFGLDPADTPALYREAVALILQGLRGGDLSFAGEAYTVSEMPMVLAPAQRPHPPLWVGLGHPDATVWPAESGINIVSNVGVQAMRRITDRYREVWQARGGGEADMPLLGMTRHIVIAEDGEEARAIGRRAYLPWRAAFMRLWDRAGLPLPNFTLPPSFDDFRDEGKAIAGTPDEVAAEVARQIEESGITYFLCRFAFGDIAFEEAVRSVELFRDSVMERKAA